MFFISTCTNALMHYRHKTQSSTHFKVTEAWGGEVRKDFKITKNICTHALKAMFKKKKLNLGCRDLFESLLNTTDLFLIKLKHLPKEPTIPLLGSYTSPKKLKDMSTKIHVRECS